MKQDDLIRQLNKFTTMAGILLERYNRLAEEYDSNRLATEEIREILKDLIKELGEWAQYLGTRLDRLEEYTILKGMGKSNSPKVNEITQQVQQEHLERGLRKQLGQQQKLLQQYRDNLATVQLQIARMGYATIENTNKEIEYQTKIERATEAIKRIREALNE